MAWSLARPLASRPVSAAFGGMVALCCATNVEDRTNDGQGKAGRTCADESQQPKDDVSRLLAWRIDSIVHGAKSGGKDMGSTVVIKIVAAVAATLVVDLTERLLDEMGVSKDTAKLPREIAKAVVAVISGVLVESALGGSSKR
jgi:hypothetical protein